MKGLKIGDLMIPAENISLIEINRLPGGYPYSAIKKIRKELEKDPYKYALVTVGFQTPIMIQGAPDLPGMNEEFSPLDDMTEGKPIEFIVFEGDVARRIWEVYANAESVEVA